MKAICFGDSNTYGYDPRGYFGGRYDADSRWVDILAAETDWTGYNMGQNGREIPSAAPAFPADHPGSDCPECAGAEQIRRGHILDAALLSASTIDENTAARKKDCNHYAKENLHFLVLFWNRNLRFSV